MPSVNYTPYGSIGNDLGNLGSLLFPDASKVMEGRYYGAKSREAQVNTLARQSELNERPYIMGMTQDSGVRPAPARYYHPPGSNPNDPPIIAPSSGITMQDGSSPPPQDGSSPPPLSQTVTTPAPGPVPGTPAIPPAQIADLAEQAGVHTGTPPASSSPAPNSGAPPAPTTTTSNGTTPSNDALSATIHPGTFWSADGGRKMAPPAQANGSPAPLAFNPNLYMAHMLAAGYSADQAKAGLASYILNFKNDHLIDEPSANYAMTVAGNIEPMAAATTIKTTGMTNATTLAQTGLQEAGLDRRKQMEITAAVATARAAPFKHQPGGPGTQVYMTTTGEAVDKGYQPFDEASNLAARNLVSIAGPGQHELRVPQSEAAGKLAYSPTLEAAANTYVPVISKQDGSRSRISLAEFNADGGRKWMEDKVAPIPTNEMFSAQTAVDAVQKNVYVPPPATIQEMKTSDLAPPRHYADGNTKLVMLTAQLYKTDDQTHGDWDASAAKATQQLIAAGVLMDPKDAAADRQSWFGQPEATKPHRLQMQDPTGTKTVTYHLIDPPPKLGTTVTTPSPGAQPATGATPTATPATPPATAPAAPVAAAKPPTDPLATDPNVGGDPTQQPNLSSVFNALVRPDPRYAIQHPALPPGALAVAPPGTPENAVTRASGGTLVIARGGFIYPAQPSPEMGR